MWTPGGGAEVFRLAVNRDLLQNTLTGLTASGFVSLQNTLTGLTASGSVSLQNTLTGLTASGSVSLQNTLTGLTASGSVSLQNTLTDFKCKTKARADIILLVDGSWSIGRLNFKTIRTFISRMYSGDPKTMWHLNEHPTRDGLLQAIANLPYKGGNTMTGMALNFILENNFKTNVGMRPEARKIGVLITDGKSQDEIVFSSQKLRDEGIELYAIGVKNADENELRSIASDPESIHMYNVNDFSFLLDIVDDLSSNICNSVKGPVARLSSYCRVPANRRAVSSQPHRGQENSSSLVQWLLGDEVALGPPTNLVTSEVTHHSFRATWTAPEGLVDQVSPAWLCFRQDCDATGAGLDPVLPSEADRRKGQHRGFPLGAGTRLSDQHGTGGPDPPD
ncbi:hypothetical protein CRUP_009536 [Coryphaenoides rupestris]|nr:hypothetical protein CRUP_009536 [Coryphaenoides rupestris]